MKTIVIIGGIILLGATVITVVQIDKKADTTPEVHHAADGHGHPAEAPTATPSVPLTSPATNPAHGLAGHRCDLAVGAPLSSANGTPAPTQNAPVINMNPAQIQQSPSPSPAALPAASSGLKVNPAHGVAGHRCDIQVGAPLT